MKNKPLSAYKKKKLIAIKSKEIMMTFRPKFPLGTGFYSPTITKAPQK